MQVMQPEQHTCRGTAAGQLRLIVIVRVRLQKGRQPNETISGERTIIKYSIECAVHLRGVGRSSTCMQYEDLYAKS